MKQLLSTYSIAGNVVTLTGVNRPLEAILSITDSTTGAILYTAQTGGASAYSQGTNSTITLTTAPGASDRLQIFYDDGVAMANAPTSVSVSASSLPLPTGAATSANQTTANTSLANIDADLGAQADAAAMSDTGTFSLISLVKRQLTKLPALVSGRIPVDGSGVTQPVSLASVPSHPVTLTNAGGANTLAVDSTGALTANASANTVTTAYSLTGAQTAGSALLVPSTNVSTYRSVTIQATSLGTGGVWQPQISLDGTNWISAQLISYGGGGVTSSLSTTTIWQLNINLPFFRIALVTSNQTSGTTNVLLSFSQLPMSNIWQAIQFLNQPSPSSNYGFGSYHSLVSSATTNATNVKNSAGTVGSLILTNNSASWAYFKLCNTSSAPTPGTTTAVLNIGVAPNSTIDCTTSFAGVRFGAGISYYVSGGTSLTDNTALGAAGTFLVNMTYV